MRVTSIASALYSYIFAFATQSSLSTVYNDNVQKRCSQALDMRPHGRIRTAIVYVLASSPGSPLCERKLLQAMTFELP
jgi:hypothetical protein